jgi:hypothetical protein
MMASQKRWLAYRLHQFVAGACTDAAFRRELGLDPRLALWRYGFTWEPLPPELRPPSVPISVRLDEEALFGSSMRRDGSPPATAERIESKLCMARAKPLLLDHGPEPYAVEAVRWFSAHGMTAILSPYEFLPASDSLKGGYSNSMSLVQSAQPGSGAWRSILAGWEADRVLLAWLCLLFRWDELLGSLLGYPRCCTRAFPKRWEDASQNHAADVAPVILEEHCPGGFAGAFGWETNIFARYFGCEVIQHFPCRLDCPKSVVLARRNMSGWSTFEPTGAAEARHLLGSPVLFTRKGEVALFPGARIQASGTSAQLDFDGDQVLMTKADGGLERVLHRAAGHLVTSSGGLDAGGARLDGWLIDFQRCRNEVSHEILLSA